MVNEKSEIVSRVPVCKSLSAAVREDRPTAPISSDVTNEGEFNSSI